MPPTFAFESSGEDSEEAEEDPPWVKGAIDSDSDASSTPRKPRSLEFPTTYKTVFDEVQSDSFLQAVCALRLFKGCDRQMITSILKRADRVLLKVGQELPRENNGPMYIVEGGCVQVQVGNTPPRAFGVGEAFNVVGMLGLIPEAEPYRPRPSGADSDFKKGKADPDEALIRRRRVQEPYEPAHGDSRPPRKLLEALRPGTQLGATEDFYSCLYNMCPCARMSKKLQLMDWLTVSIMGAKKKTVPLCNAVKSSAFTGSGAQLVVITMSMIQEIGNAAGMVTPLSHVMRSSMRVFVKNADVMANVWRTIMVRGGKLFPSVPPEVMWSIAEVSQRSLKDAGALITMEGHNFGEGHTSIHILDEGQCVIEKLMTSSSEHCRIAKPVVVARLGPGAIVGDIVLAKSNVVCPATVRAQTSVDIVTIPSSAINKMLMKYPGIFGGMTHRFSELTTLMQTRLPGKVDMLSSVALFSNSDAQFLGELASATERRIHMCGDHIKDEGDVDRTFYMVEYGFCVVEVSGYGRVAEVPPGNCFGERMLLGAADTANATVSVLSPFLLCLAMSVQSFELVLLKYPQERRNIARFKDEGLGEIMHGRQLSNRIPLFSECGDRFLASLTKQVEQCLYLPSQTITVEGAQDDSRMFVVRGGTLVVELDGAKFSELGQGASFGERAMLGASRRRQATVRATTLAFLMEISREAFVNALLFFSEEVKHFEKVALTHMVSEAASPAVFRGAPMRLNYLLNMYASWRIMVPGDEAELEKDPNTVVLIHAGRAERRNRKGGLIEELGVTSAFNELILLGLPPAEERLHLVTEIEVQLVSEDQWTQLMAEFDLPEATQIKQSVMDVIADKGMRTTCQCSTSVELLRTSALFRPVSMAFLEALAESMCGWVFPASTAIITEGEVGAKLYICVDGTMSLKKSGKSYVNFTAGKILGEACFVGTALCYEHTVRASDTCTVKMLHRETLLEALQRFPADAEHFSMYVEEGRASASERLSARLAACHGFVGLSAHFIEILCRDSEDEFYAPGEVVIRHGEPCSVGCSPMYVTLSGFAICEDSVGVQFGRMGPGEMFGEAGGTGLFDEQPYTVRALAKHQLHVARIQPHAVAAALRTYPEERDVIEDLWEKREETNDAFQHQRTHWLVKTVLPMLQATALLAGCPREMLTKIGCALVEKTYKAGEIITQQGEPADSMICILDGVAEVHARDGSTVCELTKGASFGEAAVLGLLPTRTGTLRAKSRRCRVLPVPKQTFQRGLCVPEAKDIKNAFCRLLVSRQNQVERCLPLSILGLPLTPDCTAVRAICLQAETVDLHPGEFWEIFAEDDPSGPHLGILAKGRARLESVHQGRYVSTVMAGQLLLEGLYAKYDTRLVAETRCSGYRLRRPDFDLAVAAAPKPPTWVKRFHLIEKESRMQVEGRLLATKGADDSCRQHPADPHIKQWKSRKDRALSRSLKARSEEPALIAPILLNNPRTPLAPLRQASRGKTHGSGKQLKRVNTAPELRKKRSGEAGGREGIRGVAGRISMATAPPALQLQDTG